MYTPKRLNLDLPDTPVDTPKHKEKYSREPCASSYGSTGNTHVMYGHCFTLAARFDPYWEATHGLAPKQDDPNAVVADKRLCSHRFECCFNLYKVLPQRELNGTLKRTPTLLSRGDSQFLTGHFRKKDVSHSKNAGSMFKKRKTPSAEMQRKAGEDNKQQQDEEEEITIANKPASKSVFSATAGGIHVTSSSVASNKKTRDVPEILEKKQNQAVLSLTEETEEELLGKKRTKQPPTSKFGPSSAPAFVRATTITDYNPELCKDYNQTGYCGYGDSCIYIHDRTTYVSGNMLDKRWDAELQKKKQQPVENKPAIADTATTCGICKTKDAKREYVKTRCGHVFCKECAFDRFSEGKTTCAVCSAQTLGIFNDIKYTL